MHCLGESMKESYHRIVVKVKNDNKWILLPYRQRKPVNQKSLGIVAPTQFFSPAINNFSVRVIDICFVIKFSYAFISFDIVSL